MWSLWNIVGTTFNISLSSNCVEKVPNSIKICLTQYLRVQHMDFDGKFFEYILTKNELLSEWIHYNAVSRGNFNTPKCLEYVYIFWKGYLLFVFLFMWAKYEPIWTNFCPTNDYSAHLLVQAQTIPQNAHLELFIKKKVAFTHNT